MAKLIWDEKKKKAIPKKEMEEQSINSAQSEESVKFSDMSDEKLAEYASLKGVDIKKCKTRDEVIAKLEKAEQGE